MKKRLPFDLKKLRKMCEKGLPGNIEADTIIVLLIDEIEAMRKEQTGQNEREA